MRKAILLVILSLLACAGCSSQACRPCGPGYLNNILVPQGCAGVDFRDACRRHDRCYGSDCPRKECDVQFRDEMLCTCECSRHPTLCRLRAWQWYAMTRVGGGLGYLQAQHDSGCGQCCYDCQAVSADDAPPTDDQIPTPAID